MQKFISDLKRFFVLLKLDAQLSVVRKMPILGKVLYLISLSGLFIYANLTRIGNQATKDLWHDELWRANEIVLSSSYFDIKKELHLFEYVLGNIGVWIFGRTELALRIWPLCFSILVIPFFFLAAFILLRPIGALFACFCFSISNGIIEHAHEFKMYSYELFLSQIFLFSWIVFSYSSSSGAILFFITFFLISLTAINLMPFFLPLALIFIFRVWVNKDVSFCGKSKKKLLVFIFSISMLTYIVSGWVYFSRLQQENIWGFWRGYYLGLVENYPFILGDNLAWNLNWYIFSFVKLPTNPYFCGILIALIGLIYPVYLIFKGRIIGVFVFIPFSIMVLLSLLNQYPFMQRPSTFLYPYLFISLGLIVGDLEKKIFSKYPRIILSIFFVIIVLFVWNHPPTKAAGRNRFIENTKDGLRRIQRLAKQNDILFLNSSALASQKFYKIVNESKFTLRLFDNPKSHEKSDILRQVLSLKKSYIGKNLFILVSHRARGFELYNESFIESGVGVVEALHGPGYFYFKLRVPEEGKLIGRPEEV